MSALVTGNGVAVLETIENDKKVSAFSPDEIAEMPTVAMSSPPCADRTCLAPLRWYVALVRANCETQTEKLIASLQLPVSVWVPRQRVMSQWSDRMKMVDKYYIHNYVFFHFSPDTAATPRQKAQSFSKIRSISHVYGLLEAPGANVPASIPNYQVEKFKLMLSERNNPVSIVPGMVAKGEKVRVKSGNLCGLEGNVEYVSRNEAKIFVTLDILGCAVVAIDPKLLVKVKDNEGGGSKHRSGQLAAHTLDESDWLNLHPYSEMLPSDIQYLSFANAILSFLEKQSVTLSRVRRQALALTMAGYVEDKRSNLCLFTSLVAASRRTFGIAHPVESLFAVEVSDEKMEEYMSGYNPNKLNAIDLSYLLLSNGYGRGETPDFVIGQSRHFVAALRKMGCEQLPANPLYAEGRRVLIAQNDWRGFKRFLLWLHNGRHYLSSSSYDLETLLSADASWRGVNPIYWALTFARKLRIDDGVVENIKGLKILPKASYEVVTPSGHPLGSFLFRAIEGRHTTYEIAYDEISTGRYTQGEVYSCRLVRFARRWYLLTPPVRM